MIDISSSFFLTLTIPMWIRYMFLSYWFRSHLGKYIAYVRKQNWYWHLVTKESYINFWWTVWGAVFDYDLYTGGSPLEHSDKLCFCNVYQLLLPVYLCETCRHHTEDQNSYGMFASILQRMHWQVYANGVPTKLIFH